jgi:hypothetical protein
MSGRHCTFDFFLKRPTALNMCGSFAPEESFIMGPGVYFDTRYGTLHSPGAPGTANSINGANGGSGAAGWNFSGISMPQYYGSHAGNAGEDYPSNDLVVQGKGKGGAGGAAGSGFGAGGGGGGGGSSSGRTESQNTGTYPGKNGGTGGAGAAGVCALYSLT